MNKLEVINCIYPHGGTAFCILKVHHTVLYCAALRFAALHCTVLYWTVLDCIVLFYIVVTVIGNSAPLDAKPSASTSDANEKLGHEKAMVLFCNSLLHLPTTTQRATKFITSSKVLWTLTRYQVYHGNQRKQQYIQCTLRFVVKCFQLNTACLRCMSQAFIRMKRTQLCSHTTVHLYIRHIGRLYHVYTVGSQAVILPILLRYFV